MARAIWKGSIRFGLVEIPVGLVSAEQPRELKLTMLDRRDLSPVGYARYNKASRADVPWSEIVRGYEHEAGEYVVLSDEDLRRAAPERSQAVDILQFVEGAEIDPILYDKPYYLEPTRRNSKGYVLLREVLRRTGKVGIAKVVIRTREHLAALGVHGEVLTLFLLRFAHEVRPPAEIANVDQGLEDVKVQKKELEIAERLVRDMVEPFDPAAFADEYTDAVLARVEQKVRAGETHVLTQPGEEADEGPRGREVLDLMPLLERSLRTKGVAARRATSARGKPAAKKASKRRSA